MLLLSFPFLFFLLFPLGGRARRETRLLKEEGKGREYWEEELSSSPLFYLPFNFDLIGGLAGWGAKCRGSTEGGENRGESPEKPKEDFPIIITPPEIGSPPSPLPLFLSGSAPYVLCTFRRGILQATQAFRRDRESV